MASSVIGALRVMLGMDTAEFEAGTTKAQREMAKLEREMQKRAQNIGRIGRNLTIGLTAPLTAFGVMSFNAASDAAELESAFNQTFGSMAGTMNDWARETGDAMGRSTQSMQRLANTFGIFFNQAAPTREEAARMSQTFAVLAQDLASFYNVTEEDALAKLRSGLSGEAEPLRDFGVFLSAAAVEARAMEMGLADASGAISEQSKILARYNLILEATTNAQGDVERTSDGTANRVRAAQAAFEELQVTIGTKLLPAITPLIDKLAATLDAFSRLPDGVQTTVVAVAALAAALGPVVLGFSGLMGMLGPLRVRLAAAAAGTGTMATAMAGLSAALGPVTLGLTALVGLFVVVRQNSRSAAAGTAELRRETEALAVQNDALEERLRAAGIEVHRVSDAADGAVPRLGELAGGFLGAANAADRLATSAQRAQLQTAMLALQENRDNQRRVELAQRHRGRAQFRDRRRGDPGGDALSARASQLDAQERQMIDQINMIALEIAAGGTGGGGVGGGAVGGSGSGAGGGGGGGGGGRLVAVPDQDTKRVYLDMERRLFPDIARMRELAEDRANMDRLDLGEAKRAWESRLRYELAGVDPTNFDRPHIDVGAPGIDGMLAAMERVPRELQDMQRRTEEANRRIAESFRTMTDQALSALNQLSGALTSLFSEIFGDKAGRIIGGVLQIGTQLLGMFSGGGVFGKGGGIPGFANGGSMILGGFPGIDRNVLSLNGMPIAKVSAGEGMHITPANDRGSGLNVTVTMDPSTGAMGAFVQDTAGRVVAQAAPHIVDAGANAAIGRIGRANRKRL